MGLTQALQISRSGMNVASQAISITGNNIANVNTTAFKSSQARFETQVSQTINSGSGPSAELGGTNPIQIGLGVKIGGTQKNFSRGALSPTGVNSDLAIEGNGFFVVNYGEEQRFTRAGNFQLDADLNLVNQEGGKVQGFGVDEEYNIISGATEDINIPIGTLTIAEATSNVRLGGNLNAAGDLATQGSIHTSDPITDTSIPGPMTGASLLVDLEDAGASSLFSLGDVISVTGAQKGGATLATHTFEVGPANTTSSDAFGTTVADFMAFLDDVLGIDATISGGVSVNASGEMVVESNAGLANEILLEPADVVVAGASPTVPFDFVKTQDANGESTRTTMTVFDSLGSPLLVDLSLTLESKTASGTTWRYFAQSHEDSDVDRALGTGTVSFDLEGKFVSGVDTSFNIDRTGTGAITPLNITLEFDSDSSPVSALADTTSDIAALNQDGSPIGTLEDFSVGTDGTINGIFSNSLLRTLGQVVLANFSNPQALASEAGGLYNVTANSGLPTIVAPGGAGTGTIIGGALELSNVELSQEFISLIEATTGFSASSRVLSTSDQLIQDLLNTVI